MAVYPVRPVARRLFVAAVLASAGAFAAAPAPAGEDGSRAALEQRFAQLDREDAQAAFKLALELEAAGARDLATKAYEIVVGIDPEHLAARRALGHERIGDRWLAGDDLMRAKGFVRHQGRWLTSEELAALTRPEREKAEQKAGEARVRTLLERLASEDEATVTQARRRLAMEDDRFKLAPMAMALRVEPPSLRLYVAHELGRLGDTRAIPALLKRAIYDPDEQVREAVVDHRQPRHGASARSGARQSHRRGAPARGGSDRPPGRRDGHGLRAAPLARHLG